MSAQTWRSTHGGGHRVAPVAIDCVKSAADHIRQYLEQTNAPEDKHYQLPFSWFRCLISLVSYVFFLSDVLRTGPGVREHSGLYSTLEPDSVSYFGPYKYVVVHLTTANSTADSAAIPYWSYKYDSTSVSMRSLARHLALPAWSPCVLYEASCDETQGLARSSVFAMIDSIVNAVRDYPSTWGDQQITLRATTNMYDALHHYALPWFFQDQLFRTHQAIYYDRTRLDSRTRSFCGRERTRPNSCDSVWTQLHRYASADTYPRETIWTNIERRMARLREAYPNKTLELVILDGSDDFRPGGYTHQGFKGFEVIALARVRDCGHDPGKPNECVTVAVEDYRQESGVTATNVTSWYPLIARLRILGQLYAWLRLGLLAAGAVAAHAHDKRLRYARLRAVWRAVFFIPSQVVVYGSLIPIACYAVAHVLDSPFVYIHLVNFFMSPLGGLQVSIGEMLLISAVAMRSVWLLASICHVVLAANTRRSWSSLRGIPGAPEFLIVFVASANIFGAVRMPMLRYAKVIEIEEVTPSHRRLAVQNLRHNLLRGHLSSLAVGVRIDARTVSVSLGVVVVGMLLFRMLTWVCARQVTHRASVISRTLVPYSAGSLWLTNALAVSWHGMLFEQPLLRPVEYATNVPTIHKIGGPAQIENREQATRSAATLSMTGSAMAQHLHREMVQIGTRDEDVREMAVVVNLAAMTDPMTFLQLRGLQGQLVGVYIYKPTGSCVLIPLACATSEMDTEIEWDDLQLCAVITSREMAWPALLRCGTIRDLCEERSLIRELSA